MERWLILVCVISTCLYSFVSCQSPEIVNDILPDVKRVGMTGRLNCTVARLGKNSVQWSFLGHYPEEVISVDQTIQIWNPYKGGIPTYQVLKTIPDPEEDRTTFTLVISRLMPEYSGQYQCTVTVKNEEYWHWTKKIGTITVQHPPMIRPGATDSVKLIQKGGNASVTCDAYGVPSPNITWVRSDGKLLPNGKAMHRGRVLRIEFATVRFAGVYRCVADNNIKPPAEVLTQVYVFQEPTVRVLQDSVGQYANGRLEAKLDCIVQGYPTPTVYWMVMNGDEEQVLTNQDKYETTKQATDNQNLMNGEQWYTLRIKFVQAKDYRVYYCVGVNSEGEGRGTVTLFSTWDCQGPQCYSLDSTRAAATISRLSPLLMVFACLITLFK